MLLICGWVFKMGQPARSTRTDTLFPATTLCRSEALGMSLPGSAAIPAPYRDRQEVSWRTGKRIVEMVREDLKPSDIMTRAAFLNAIRVNSAIGGSTNAPLHLAAIARPMGVDPSLAAYIGSASGREKVYRNV